LDLNFTKPFLKQIIGRTYYKFFKSLGRDITLSDFEDVDPDLAKNLRWMMDHSVEGLEMVFGHEDHFFGQNIMHELIPNGYETYITDENKELFLRRICEEKMRDQIKDELQAFLKGFNTIFPTSLLEIFSPSELELLIAGAPTIDVKEIRATAQVIDGNLNSQLVIWLFEILEEFSQKELAALVYFISGI